MKKVREEICNGGDERRSSIETRTSKDSCVNSCSRDEMKMGIDEERRVRLKY